MTKRNCRVVGLDLKGGFAKVRVQMKDNNCNTYYSEWDISEYELYDYTIVNMVSEHAERSEIEKAVRQMVRDRVDTITGSCSVEQMNMDVCDSNGKYLFTYRDKYECDKQALEDIKNGDAVMLSDLKWFGSIDIYEDIELTLNSYRLDKMSI